MAAIKNIIFDLGGVLLDIDFNRTAQAFAKLGVKNFDALYSRDAAVDLFEKLETGHISNNDFYTAMQQHCAAGTSAAQVQQAWNAILVAYRKESIAALKTLKEKYSLYLLSNTNSIHHAEFTKMYTSEFEGQPFESNFTQSWFSHLLQMRKPYAETYLHVLKAGSINGSETIFIDDSPANIDGAKKISGLQTHLLLPHERIETLGL
jgi:glucose-1-phosphatase